MSSQQTRVTEEDPHDNGIDYEGSLEADHCKADLYLMVLFDESFAKHRHEAGDRDWQGEDDNDVAV